METNCIGNNHEQHAEYNLLFDTLRNLWLNYLQAFDNADVKKHWLRLFLFNFQFVSEELMKNEEVQTFFNPIPEELCSYLLEQIYEIISKSDLYMPSGEVLSKTETTLVINGRHDIDETQTSEKNKQSLQLLKKNHNLAQLILKDHSDCSKIIALRQFLTQQLGQHLLQFLLKVDLKLVASLKSLGNLCVNLFPNCPWSNKYIELDNNEGIFAFIGNLQFYQKFKSKLSNNMMADATEKENPDLLKNIPIYASLDDFIQAEKTSDEIALIFIKILLKCVQNEPYSSLHTDQSIFMLALNFSLDCLSMESQSFSSPQNTEVVKYYLLKLKEQCLICMFSLTENSLHDVQFQCIFAKLIAALQNNLQNTRLLYALMYIIFAIIHNVVAIYSQKTLWNDKVNLYTLKFLDENIIDCCLSTMEHLLKHQPPEQNDIKILYHAIFRTFLKIIENLKKYDMMMSTSLSNNCLNGSSNSGTPKPAAINYRKIKTKQQHCLANESKLSCCFQNILITILPSLPQKFQEQSMQHLARSGLCCCHYNLELINTILNIILNLAGYYQKCAYKFLYYRILNTIFLKLPIENASATGHRKQFGLFNCVKCNTKLKSLDFHQGFLQIYESFYNKLHDINDIKNLIYFLKHLKHLSFLLTNDIAAGALAEIVLPIFRKYKACWIDRKCPLNSPQYSLKFWQKSLSTASPVNKDNLRLNIKSGNTSDVDISKLLHECLTIFAMYLRDIRLVKAFYNEENIKHLEDLLEEPFLIRAVCDLIKIGIDNITYLGDNSHEQNISSRSLITLQFNSSERAQSLFNSLIKKSKIYNRSSSATQFWLLENATSSSAMKENTLKFQTVDILHIVALQWTLNYELLKTSQYFYNEFAKIYSINKEEDEENIINESDLKSCNSTVNRKISLKPGDKTIVDILQLNYNALMAFLMLPPKRKIKAPKYSAKSKQSPEQCKNDTRSKHASQHQQQSTPNSEFDTGLEMLEDFINSIQSTKATSNSAVILQTTFSNCSFDVGNLSEFPYKAQQSVQQSSYLLQMLQNKACQMQENVAIFDIRNHKNSLNTFKKMYRSIQQTTSSYFTTLYEDEDTFNYCSVDDPKTLTQNLPAQASNEGIINKIFNIFGSLFPLSSVNYIIHLKKSAVLDEQNNDIDVDLLPMYETNSNCKKLLLKIFEATMAICIKGYQNEEVEKMQKHLRKLKGVILANACYNWEQYAEVHSRENAVMQTLQCLLKIAELSNSTNDPAAVITQTLSTEDQKNLSEIRPSSRSLNSSGDEISCSYQQLSTELPSKNTVLTPTTPPQGLLLGNGCDVDYFSIRAPYICVDSELEFSENDQDEFYLAADEGYEADAEIQINSEDGNISDAAVMWQPFRPSSRYRTPILHGGICRLVMDILIELSEKCIQSPTSWCNNLSQLLKRLSVIREYLGSPLCLLKGFSAVLKCHDVRLRELQQGILELISDLNTPEVLSTFFGILSSKNPSVDILIKYMHYICTNSLKKCQPSVELEFPVNINGNCVSNSDPDITDHIQRVRIYHLKCQAITPFTRSPCIIPITHGRIWNPEGVTVSMWLQAKVLQNHKSSSQIIEDDTISSSDMKSHILSVGTNQAMLSLYLNNNLTLTFETFKPNADISKKTTTPMDYKCQIKQNGATNAAQKIEYKTIKRNHHHNNFFREPPTTSSRAGFSSGVTSPLSKAFKHTKLAFLSSLSNIHMFNGTAEIDAVFERTHLDLTQCCLTKNKWTHITFAIEIQTDTVDICILIDGLEQHCLVLPFRNVHLLTKTHIFQMIAIGDCNISKSSNTTGHNESLSTLDGLPMRLSISNVILFKRAFKRKEDILHLTAMGPDFAELTQCHVANWKPNYGYLNANKLKTTYFSNHTNSLKLLENSRILCYSAARPDMAMCYDTTAELNNNTNDHPCGVIHYGDLVQNSLKSLQTATILCGGLSNLLYLFARVVEISFNSTTQSLALDILLNTAFSESQLYTEFQRNDYINLISYVIKTEKCCKDCNLLGSIINNACSQPIVVRKCDTLQVNNATTAAIVYPKLFTSILHRYSDWHRSGAENSNVLDMLFQSILALTREKHPQRDFNIEQLSKEGLMRQLLNLCKVYVIESPNPVFISKKAAKGFVNILSVFAGSAPKPCLLDEIMKLLLLLQKPSECYITHDRSKFYFLLTPEVPAKEKLYSAANFGRVTATFKLNTRKTNKADGGKPLNDLNAISNLKLSSDINAARQSRINRLRKLHKTVSAYCRPLVEFAENLEHMADCTKLNKHALRLVNPNEASKWRLKYKRVYSLITPTRCIKSVHVDSLHKTKTHKRIQKKILRLCTTNLLIIDGGGKHFKVYRKKTDSNLRSMATPSDVDSSEYSALNEVPKPKQTTSQPKKSKQLHKTDTFRSVGIAALQSGLLLLLKDFLYLLPDSDIDDVLNHYIKVEFLLVLANNNSVEVRTAAIKLINALTNRLYPQDIQICIKALYPYHLANQLSIGFCDSNMFQSCLQWVCETVDSLDTILACDINLRIQNRFGLNALLAIASKSTADSNTDQQFSEKAFKILKWLYLEHPNEQQAIIEVGLIQCCVKALYNLYAKTTSYNAKAEESIGDLLTTIGQISLKSIGHINIIWDIINMLMFYQEKQPQNIIKAYRSILANILMNWLNMFFIKTNVPLSFEVFKFGNFSMTEAKTRLELLINRCCQFYMIFNGKSAPSQNEIELYKLVVSYNIATNQRCNNFIARGLHPSQPRDLRCFIIDALWISCVAEFMPTNICDSKLIKALLWLSLLEDIDEPTEHLQALCNRLGIKGKDSAWNLENELQRMDLNKTSEAAKQKSSLDKTIYRCESLAQGCIESSMIMTRRVAELQNSERKLLMSHMKDYDDTHAYAKWLEIVRRLTHEGSPWFSEQNNERSWELDDTEGPSRVHTRLRKCHLDLDKRFFMKEYSDLNTTNNSDNSTIQSKRSKYSKPLDYLTSSYDQQLNISLNSQILYNFPAKYLPVDAEINGEIIVTDHKLYFLATYRCKYFYLNCDISNITEIWLKRYQHQEKAFEIFLDTNQSLFFSLQNQEDWKIMRDVFCDKIVTPPDQSKVLSITQQWREGLLTNWEYLMTLNQIAGRTYNDLMQYPVLPWILSNYTTDILDLMDLKNFRELSKPIAIQNERSEEHFINNYAYIKNTMPNIGSITLKPYHYSSHYSNSGTVLHFLVRVPPFTNYFLRYQDNNFDIPDRTFHALNTTYCLASRDSTTDVKELIPEFFCLPEMFENYERFNFGYRQNGERVENVSLPPWCLRDPRFFVLIHRQALESELVRYNLHHWIDLIFGFKQTGEAAVDAINVFHPATYDVFLESEIDDPIEREAVQTMIKTYGQMPRQLFKSPHPPSKPLQYQNDKQIFPSVRGLRWGIYVGSPQLPEPTLGNTHKLVGAEYLLSFNNTNVIYGLPTRSYVMQGAETDTYNVVSWGYDDRIVRIQPLNKINTRPKNLLYNSTFDDITACGCDANSNQLWFGHKSGRLSIYKCSSVEVTQRTGKSRQSYVKGLKLSYNSAFRKIACKAMMDIDSDLSSPNTSPNSLNSTEADVQQGRTDLSWSGPTVLIRHTDEITCIALSVDFKIAVTAGKDGIAVIWDLNNWTYVRTIERPAEIHHSPITLLSISPTLGDIVTVHSLIQQPAKSYLYSEGKATVKPIATNAYATPPPADECFEVTEENLDDFVNVSVNPEGKSILRLHSVNARYIQHFVHEDRILALCYSYVKEGVGVNAIATAVERGIVRLWSSWNLSFITEIITGLSNIKSLTYSTHQHLVVLTEQSHIQVWETKGLCGNAPKFPQIAYK